MAKTGGRLTDWVARMPARVRTTLKGQESPSEGGDVVGQDELDSVAATLSWALEEIPRLQRELELGTREMSEALKQQAATAEALKAISRSTSNLQTLLDLLAESGAKITNCAHAAIFLRDGEMLRSRAVFGARSKRDLNQLVAIDRGTIGGRVMLSGQPEFIPNTAADREYDRDRLPMWSKAGALMAVPLLRDGMVEGVFSVGRPEPAGFTVRQSELLQTLADQAVIAVEKARLIDGVQAGNREFAATSDVLRVIARSATEVQPVFDAVAQSAHRLCNGQYASVLRFDGSHLHVVACEGLDARAAGLLRRAFPAKPGRESAGARAVLSGAVEQIADVSADPDYVFSGLAKMLNTGSVAAVPMIHGKKPIGAIVIDRAQTGYLPERQVELLKTLADQAVIAIENARIIEETQARDRELTATSEILHVISRSSSDVQPVFDAIAQSARRLCNSHLASVFRFDGSDLHFMACESLDPKAAAIFRQAHRLPLKPGRDSASARAVVSGTVEQIPDVSKDPDFAFTGFAKVINTGSVVAVPMMRDKTPIGAIAIDRVQTGYLPERQVELLQTFADQAEIAIENARLIEETQARNRELTATGEVLRVISRSSTDTQPVFDAIARIARRLCNAQIASVVRFDGTHLHFVACDGLDPKDADRFRKAFPLKPGRESAGARAVLSRTVEQIPDVGADPDHVFSGLAKRFNTGSVAAVPMMHDKTPIGAIVIDRAQTGYLPERQVELLQTFADQAVIAIENVRLFKEVEARTDDLSEALRQQTATADVLKTISRSTFDLPVILKTLIASAARLCNVKYGGIYLRQGDQLCGGAVFGGTEEDEAEHLSHPLALDRKTVSGRVALSGRVEQIPDLRADPEYDEPYYGGTFSNIRALMGVPLLREGRVEGAFFLGRQEPGPFTERQCDLVQTFADQAVIAIANVRLFDEVKARNRELTEALEQQTATSAILRAIAASPTDIQPVLDAVAESAAKLCGAYDSVILLKEGDTLSGGAHHGPIPFAPVKTPLARNLVSGRAVIDRMPVHVHDMLEAADEFPASHDLAIREGQRAVLAVPLLCKEEAIGALAIRRREAEPFSQKQIDLLSTFADQAVIAIENVRLFQEVQERNRDLTEALEQQTATGAILRAIAASPTDIQPVLDAVVESAAKLCAAYDSLLLLKDGDALSQRAHHGPMPIVTVTWPIGRGLVSGRAVVDRRPVHVHDLLEAADEFPESHDLAIQEGQRAILAVPLLREQEAVGALAVRRREAEPFSQKQIDLLSTFAAQAVIAIENVRLFEQVQARTRELQEALDHQTATGEVLNVISRSPSELQPVLDVIIETAVRLCEADAGTIDGQQDGRFIRYGGYGFSSEFNELMRRSPAEMMRGSITGRTLLEGKFVHVLDAQADPEYTWVEALELGGTRTALGVPLLRERAVIGAIALIRRTVRPFTDKQIELVTTFADQAVIAIENARLFEEVQARNRELTEALEQQAATAEILRTISTAPTDVQAVFEAIVRNAVFLCGSLFANVFRFDGELLHWVASHNVGPSYVELVKTKYPMRPDSSQISGRVLLTRSVVRLEDALADADYDQRFPQAMGWRRMLGMPLLREGNPLGVIVVGWAEPGPVLKADEELLKTFADQAVIAIENARLFEEVRARNRELTEALEQQTATSTILRVIAASPTDIQPVLRTVAESAAKLCEAYDAVIFLADGDQLAVRAHHGPIPIDVVKLPVGRGLVAGRAFVDRKPVHVHDLPEAADEFPAGATMAARLGFRTILSVPLLREDEAIGAIMIRRHELRPFSQKQIDLLTTFADQAVIAIENARLFDEVKARTSELGEALQQQTATADVLKAISRSTFDLPVVLRTLVASAVKLCGAAYGGIVLRRGDLLHVGAVYGGTAEDEAEMINRPLAIDRRTVSGRVAMSGQVEHIPDIFTDFDFDFDYGSFKGRISDTRALMGVPLLHEGRVEGAFFLGRPEPGAFSDRQNEIVQTFADQAVIAIKNVRLFDEVQARTRELSEALQHQTATAEVLQVISRDTFNLQTVLDTLVESVARLCEADHAWLFRREAEEYRWAASYGFSHEQHEQMKKFLMNQRIVASRASIIGRVALEGKVIHVADVLSDPEYEWRELQSVAEYHTAMGVPLLREGVPIGVMTVTRLAEHPFTDRQINLMKTFADQAVIAIENARLFEEVQARNRDLTESLEQQTATSEILRVISSSPTDIQPVFDVLAENATRLCGAALSVVYRYDGKLVHLMAHNGWSSDPIFSAARRAFPMPPDRKSAGTRAILSGAVEEIPDTSEDRDYAHGVYAGLMNTSVLAVPMLRDGVPIGAIAVDRRQTGTFPKRQVELLKTFADQAVIAIENVRLFEEVQARTREVSEALEFQTATGEVLKVISRSTSQLQPVLDVIVEIAVRLCEADYALVSMLRDGWHHLTAANNAADELVRHAAENPIPPGRGSLAGRTAQERRTVHIPDVLADPEYTLTERQKIGKYRSMLGVPLLREGAVIGTISLVRNVVRPFTDKEIELVTTFADQAVIAIENVRLFEEVQARTAELARSVGELRALGDVSQAVNSTLNLKTVLETIVAKAVQLSDTDAGAIYVYSKSADRFRLRATYGMSAELVEAISGQAMGLHDAGIGDAARLRAPVQVPNLGESPLSAAQKIVLDAGFRSVLVVPLLRPNKVVGALVVRRRTPGRFSDSTVQLLETFAAQSVLAIQNARLFSEIEEKGRQLAVASRHKSQFLANMSHELRTPLNSVLGFTEMLADGLYGELPEKAKTTLGRVQANGRHLLGLINDVLDLSKIEAGQLVLTIDDYAIGQIVKTVAASTEPLAREKGLTLSVTVAEGLPMGRGDERRLSQVLLNLVGNAVKFTERGSIEIAADARDGFFEVLVRDTGPGIAPEHQQRIFEEFQQVDESSTRQKGGTGLGLAISKRIVELHGGTIGLDSEPGSGSTFRIAIPVRAGESKNAA